MFDPLLKILTGFNRDDSKRSTLAQTIQTYIGNIVKKSIPISSMGDGCDSDYVEFIPNKESDYSGVGDETVLIVDDEESIRRSLARLLKNEGFRPITTGDGHKVVELCEKSRPIVVFLDLSMPNFNGPQVIKALQQKMGEAHPPVVWITGTVSPESIINLKGAVDCIPKPLDISKILEITRKYSITAKHSDSC